MSPSSTPICFFEQDARRCYRSLVLWSLPRKEVGYPIERKSEQDASWGNENKLGLHGAHKYGFVQAMKTTLEIPDTVFRRAKTAAASRGVTFREFVTEAVREKLVPKKGSRENKPGWTKVFGAAKQHSRELQRMDALIEAEFEQIDPEDEP